MKRSLKKTSNEERKKEINKVIQRISNQELSEKQQLEKQKLKDQLIEEKKRTLKSKNDKKPIYVNKGKIVFFVCVFKILKILDNLAIVKQKCL